MSALRYSVLSTSRYCGLVTVNLLCERSRVVLDEFNVLSDPARYIQFLRDQSNVANAIDIKMCAKIQNYPPSSSIVKSD